MPIDDENNNIGQNLLAKLADVEDALGHCAEQNAEIKQEVSELSRSVDRVSVDLVSLAEAQKEDDAARASAVTTWRVVKTVGVIASVLLLPMFAWLGKEFYAHYSEQVEHIDSTATEVDRNAVAIETHTDTIGHEPLRERVGANRESITTIETQLDTITQSQTKIQQSQERIEQSLRRQRWQRQ